MTSPEEKITDMLNSDEKIDPPREIQSLKDDAMTDATGFTSYRKHTDEVDDGRLNELQNYTTWSSQIRQHTETHRIPEEGRSFEFAKKKSVRRVYLAIKVKRISDVDNIRETFRCRFHCYFNWVLTYEEYQDYLRAKASHNLSRWEPKFKPRYEFVNIVEAHEVEEVTYPNGPFRVSPGKNFAPAGIVGFDAADAKMVRLKVDFDITFCEELELRNFPFDCQDYSIVLRESSGIEKASFVPEMRTINDPDRNQRLMPSNFARVDPSFSVLDEWEFHNTRVEFAYSSSQKSRGQTAYHQVTIRFKMRRKYMVYFWNVALYMLVISFLSLTSFFIDVGQNGGERLTLVITLLLTAVANQHVVFELLPNVPYLTILHKYILTCFIFIALVTIQSALAQVDTIGWFKKNTNTFDSNSLYGYAGGWMFYHAVFLVWCTWKRHWESQKLYLDSDEIEDYVDSYDKHNFTIPWRKEDMQWRGDQNRIATFVDTDPRYENIPHFSTFCGFFCNFIWRMIMCRCCPRDECCGYFPAGTCNATSESCCGCCCRNETPRQRFERIAKEKRARQTNQSTVDLDLAAQHQLASQLDD